MDISPRLYIMSTRETIEYVHHDSEASKKMRKPGKTLGLSMIVKDEEHIILKCLESIAPYIDYWVINDTGSTDRTPELILDFFKNRHPIPGELHHVAWKNFSHNRNVALNAVKGRTDYILLADADFILNVHDEDFKSKLRSPGYLIKYDGGLDYRQLLLIEARHNWEYMGVTHEYIDTYPNKLPSEITDMISIDHTFEGSSRVIKFERDAKLLEEDLKLDPKNSRSWFYLGQSYKDLQMYDKAIEAYTKRTQLTDYDEEVFYSWYQIGMCKKKRGDLFYSYVGDLMKAYLERRHRLEPLYQILDTCGTGTDKNLAEWGYQVGKLGEDLKYPTYDLLFIEKPIYEWMYLDMWATCAQIAGYYSEAIDITQRILDEDRCPIDSEVKRFINNIKYLKSLKLLATPHLKPAPFEFIRLKPNAKRDEDHRIATILLNHNMPERTTRIVNFLRHEGQETAQDIIVVDNGSDTHSASNFTTVYLTQHLDNARAWKIGLDYANNLERQEGFKYWGYLIISNNAEIPLQVQTGSIVDGLRQVLLQHPRARAVQPVLTVDSSIDLPHLIYPFVKELDRNHVHNPPRLTNIVGNDFVLYHRKWFDEVGGFPNEMPTGLGANIHMSYLARSNGYQLYLAPQYIIRVIHNLDSKISRSTESSEALTKRGYSDFCNFARREYGENYMKKLQEAEITDDDITPEWYNRNQIDRLINTMLNFEKSEGGHKLLMDHIYHHHQGTYSIKRRGQAIRLLEIGATDEPYPHMDSTGKLELLCRVYGYQFISIDKDKNVTDKNSIRSNKLNNENPNFHLNGFRTRHVTEKAKRYLQSELENRGGPDLIHYVYIDTVNVIASNNSEESQLESRDNNLEILKLLTQIVPKGGLICLSHTHPDVQQYLTTLHHYRIISQNPQTTATLFLSF